MTISKRPVVIAHRGSSFAYPENTVAAFDAALAEGADGLELDLRLSKDQQVVVCHDAHLAKAGRESLRVCDLNWTELQQLDVGAWRDASFAGLTIPHLTEIVDRYGSRTKLLLELKIDDEMKAAGSHRILVQRVLETVQSLSAEASLFLLCFDLDTLTYSHSLSPGMRHVVNLSELLKPAQLAVANHDFLFAYSHQLETLSASFAEQVRGRKRPLMTWSCNTHAQVERALDFGAEYLMTDKPGWLRGVVDRANH